MYKGNIKISASLFCISVNCISDEGREHYHNSIQQGGQEIYDAVLQRREQLKN